MIEAPIANVTLEDVLELRDQVQRETHSHELKGALDLRTDKHKTTLAVQVCSFANAAGGDLILGVPEKAGLIGLEGEPDDVELQIREITRRRVDPKPPTLQIRALPCGSDRHVYVVSVPRSWTAPHMLTQQSRFYTRDGNGKRPMDRFEVERAFAEAGGRTDEIRSFRRARMDVLREEAGSVFFDPRLMVTHLVPLQPCSLPTADTAFDARLRQASFGGRPIFQRSRTTLDGLQLDDSREGEGPSLTDRAIVFRTGRLEYAWTLASRSDMRTRDGIPIVSLVTLQRDLEESVRGLLGGLVENGLESPVCMMVSMLGLKGSVSRDRTKQPFFDGGEMARYTCDRDELVLPSVTLEGDVLAVYPAVVGSICRVLWQCFGEQWPGRMILTE